MCTQLSPPISPQPSIVVPPSPHFISGCQYWCWCQQCHFTFTLVTPDIFIMSKLSGVEHSWFSTFQCWSPLSTAQLITSKWKFGEYQLHSFSVMVFWCKQDSATFDISKHSWLITQIPLKLLIDDLQARYLPCFHVFITYSRYLHTTCFSRYLFSYVWVSLKPFYLKMFEFPKVKLSWNKSRQGGRLGTVLPRAPHRGGEVAGGWYVNNRSVVDTFHYKVDNCHDYVVCTVHTQCPPTPAHSQRGLYRAGVIGKIFLCQLG